MDNQDKHVFPFLFLPFELRLQIYRLIIPTNQAIEFVPYPNHRNPTMFPRWLPVTAGPLYLNKQLHDEAAAVLYGENTFTFHFSWTLWTIDPMSVNTLRISPYVTKYLKKCKISIQHELQRRPVYKRIQSWLANIVKIFGPQHTLNQLCIELRTGRWHMSYPSDDDAHPHPVFSEFSIQNLSNIEYCLEPLAKLYGIRKVDICGHVHESFAAKLGAVISAERKREIPLMEYEEKTFMWKPQRRKRRLVTRKKRKWYEPSLNWDEV